MLALPGEGLIVFRAVKDFIEDLASCGFRHTLRAPFRCSNNLKSPPPYPL
jgi:hypothetical protein